MGNDVRVNDLPLCAINAVKTSHLMVANDVIQDVPPPTWSDIACDIGGLEVHSTHSPAAAAAVPQVYSKPTDNGNVTIVKLTSFQGHVSPNLLQEPFAMRRVATVPPRARGTLCATPRRRPKLQTIVAHYGEKSQRAYELRARRSSDRAAKSMGGQCAVNMGLEKTQETGLSSSKLHDSWKHKMMSHPCYQFL